VHLTLPSRGRAPASRVTPLMSNVRDRMTPLRVALAIVLIFFATAVAAGDSATFRGQSAKYSVQFQDPMAETDSIIEVHEYVGDDFGYTRNVLTVPFKSECLASEREIRCNRKGKSPLAGAVYRRTRDATPVCPGVAEDRFTCIAGCTGSAPRYISISPYEC
jgi:hypothetical protein